MVIHDESRTPLAGEICPNPLQEDRQTEARCRQELQVDGAPSKPRCEASYSHLVTLQNRKALADHRHAAFVEVAKRPGRTAADYPTVNEFSYITSLLYGYL